MGIREPIFMVAFCWSVARMRGFCRIFVLLSVSSRLAVTEPIVTAKSVALRWARLEIVSAVDVAAVVVVPVVPVPLVVDVLAVGDCSATPALLGHAIPRFRSQFLLTSSTAMSTTTSARALSRSLMSFCASSSSSGVARITMAFWLATP